MAVISDGLKVRTQMSGKGRRTAIRELLKNDFFSFRHPWLISHLEELRFRGTKDSLDSLKSLLKLYADFRVGRGYRPATQLLKQIGSDIIWFRATFKHAKRFKSVLHGVRYASRMKLPGAVLVNPLSLYGTFVNYGRAFRLSRSVYSKSQHWDFPKTIPTLHTRKSAGTPRLSLRFQRLQRFVSNTPFQPNRYTHKEVSEFTHYCTECVNALKTASFTLPTDHDWIVAADFHYRGLYQLRRIR